ncbi:MAG: prepilin-type N-terminal cleavage/methylation domain-containing protein [Pirellulales bacterium]|nr:prepilin-type N-terminal cleavage/methylation domain-containing protein [Pirellulales bacterium]
MHSGTLTHDRAVDAVDWQTRSGSKSGFTLVELLVVLVIIGMLASMVGFAMFRSMQAAREAKTQALISKLHNVIVRHWDTFETGQIPFTSSVSDPTDAQRLLAVREWMQFKMPNSTGDLTGSPTLINKPLTNTVINDMGGISGNAPTDAQCLYRLATLLADDDLDRINLFSENETKDINGDGTPDIFIDGWGQPIRFIRWPAGLVTDIQDCNSTTSPDPFDPTGIGSGYALFPLIYSHGSDKKGLEPSTTGSSDPFANTYTATSDDNDNIHNHRLNARLQ